jgi:hypothetical protein
MKNMDNTDIQFFLMVQPSGDRKPTYANNDIAMGCPICNEGKSLGRKQRCHLYNHKDSLLVHCFNCDWHSNLYNFLKEVDDVVLNQYKNEKRGSYLKELEQEASIELESKDIQEKRKEDLLTFKFNDLPFTSITESKWGMSYLYKRKINPKDFKDFFFVGTESLDLHIKGENKKIAFTPGIIVPLWFNRQENLCYGFQYRSLESKRFFTYLPEENQNYKVYNYFGSKSDKVYIFESVFDLYSNDIPLENKIASLGSDINDTILSNYKKVIFCLDNQNFDETSKKKLEKYSSKGFQIFIWDKSIKQKDFNELLQGVYDKIDNPYSVISKMIEKGIQTPLLGTLKMKLQGLMGLG